MTLQERPDWAVGRDYCPTCKTWVKVRRNGRLFKHMRMEPGRWHKVPCEGSDLPGVAA